jgi:hypothetical protein
VGTYAKRIFAVTSTALLLTLGAAGGAAADTSSAPGPGFCGGPPGQIGLVQIAKENGMPPGQIVSYCNLDGHGQNQGNGGGSP